MNDDDLDAWIEEFCRAEEAARKEMGMLNIGERVIFTVPDPAQDGLRGIVTLTYGGNFYDVKLDNGDIKEQIGANKLEREADYPDYPRPQEVQHGDPN